MNFANRYELFESITTGAVETFPARDVLSEERVLVYVFESAAPGPRNVPTIEWVLEAFNRVAPAPREIAINAGRYPGTAFVYLVTKMPAADALNRWIEAYQGRAPETQEFRAIAKPENKESPARQPGVEPSQAETSGFPALRSDPASVNSGLQPSRPADAGGASLRGPAQSGSFTSLFLGEFNKSTEASKAAETSYAANPGVAGSTRDPFPTLPHSVAGGPHERATGEFTKFFQGPFSGEASPDTPKNLVPRTMPEATPGEFTRLFGPAEKGSQPAPLGPAPGVQTENLSLTQILSEPPRGTADQQAPPPMVTPPLGFEPASIPPAHGDAHGRPVSSAQVEPSPTPRWPADPRPPASPREAPPPPAAAAGYYKEDASQLFSSRRTGEPAPPAGPSEYTMVISRPSMPPAEPPAQAPNPAPVPPAAMPPLPPPRMPAVPPLPPMPRFAPPPKMPVAAPLPLMPPAMAAPPQLGQTPLAAKPVSYWPLVLGMTVLFFLGVLLVMYFVLKH